MVALQHATEVYGDVGALTSEDGGQVKNVQLCAAPLPCFWAGELRTRITRCDRGRRRELAFNFRPFFSHRFLDSRVITVVVRTIPIEALMELRYGRTDGCWLLHLRRCVRDAARARPGNYSYGLFQQLSQKTIEGRRKKTRPTWTAWTERVCMPRKKTRACLVLLVKFGGTRALVIRQFSFPVASHFQNKYTSHFIGSQIFFIFNHYYRKNNIGIYIFR